MHKPHDLTLESYNLTAFYDRFIFQYMIIRSMLFLFCTINFSFFSALCALFNVVVFFSYTFLLSYFSVNAISNEFSRKSYPQFTVYLYLRNSLFIYTAMNKSSYISGLRNDCKNCALCYCTWLQVSNSQICLSTKNY